jgi:hypothetical protein
MIIIKNIFLFFRLLKANIQMAFLCLSFVIFANLFAIYFISHEQYIYYWDWAHYWKMYIHLNELFIDNPLKALYFLNHSIRHDDYNPLPILPLIPFAWLFGTSRLTYILTITNISLLPSAFMMALFAQRIFVQQFLKPAILPLAIAGASILALHPLWIPVLRGFPDILGLLVINIILLRIFSQPFYQQKIKYLITTGVSLCLLVLLRRWYTFWVVAFFPALVISQCIYFYQQDMAWRYYVLVIRNATIIGLTFTISLFVFATPFMIRIIHTDYADLYSAYKTGLSTFDTAFTVLPYFGCITIALAIMGLVWLVVQKNTRIIGGFLLIQAFIVIYLFARTQNFGVQHYYLLLTSIAIGITTLIMNLLIYIKNKGLKIFLIGSVFTILIIQSISIFLALPDFVG